MQDLFMTIDGDMDSKTNTCMVHILGIRQKPCLFQTPQLLWRQIEEPHFWRGGFCGCISDK